MNPAMAIDTHWLEAQMHSEATIATQIDAVLPIESAPKPTGVFSSDCCGSNNYPK